MKEKIAIFLSDDEFSKYSFKKLKKNFIPVPFSFKKLKFTKTNILSPYNLSEIFDFLKKAKIKKIILVGKIPATILFDKKFDFLGRQLLTSTSNWTGEDILKNGISLLKNYGIETISLKKFFKDEIAERKIYSGNLEENEKKDIKTGISFLLDIEKYRCGQSIVIKNGMLICLEGIEGTDEMIKRAGRYCSDFVFVKIAGKQKDERFDLPVIGPDTAKLIAKTKGKVIAVESGKTIIFDKEKTINYCKKFNITLLGI